MYQINLVTYTTSTNKRNSHRNVVNREKGILGGKFESAKLAEKVLRDFFENSGYRIGNGLEQRDKRTYIKSLLFGNLFIETIYKITRCS